MSNTTKETELLAAIDKLRSMLAEAQEHLGVHACNLRIDGDDEDAEMVEALCADIEKTLEAVPHD